MITLHDLLDNFCCIDPYTDYAIVNIKTGEVLVDRVHDRTYTVDDVDDYAKFLPYARKQIRKWEVKDGKMIFYILPPRKLPINKEQRMSGGEGVGSYKAQSFSGTNEEPDNTAD